MSYQVRYLQHEGRRRARGILFHVHQMDGAGSCMLTMLSAAAWCAKHGWIYGGTLRGCAASARCHNLEAHGHDVEKILRELLGWEGLRMIHDGLHSEDVAIAAFKMRKLPTARGAPLRRHLVVSSTIALQLLDAELNNGSRWRWTDTRVKESADEGVAVSRPPQPAALLPPVALLTQPSSIACSPRRGMCEPLILTHA
eukprot:CAMPEP_0183340930 /NCGR_PEP_ID=MMETSP0164_2-20130417/7316_1 /TAXON_ID=221442 /ORGANISM="Coccolithus pelagicus ssp braarudi, Strain PLY182g" /LENGTH=197 /DNA_ID=CAMNT_0025511143 /DNA_START=17 /DNA_END=611 /DNA_ORIENTATION=+